MNVFIPMYQYAQILSKIGEWKAISMKSLYQEITPKTSYSAFCRKIKKLQTNKYIKSIIGGRGQKFLALTALGSKHTGYDAFYEESEAALVHDLTATKVIRTLNSYKNFHAGVCTAGKQNSDSQPDGEIEYTSNKNNLYTIAIEVELTQKSKRRIEKKFKHYSGTYNNSYDSCIYVFREESIFKSYSRRLIELREEEEIRGKSIVLILDKDLTVDTCHLDKAKIFIKDEVESFQDIFNITDTPKAEVIEKQEISEGHVSSQEVHEESNSYSNQVDHPTTKKSPWSFFARI